MACNERGMALVSVVLILSVLLIMAHVLMEKVWQSTSQSASASSREQLFWTAQAGLEEARRQLAVTYAGSGGWQSLLACNEPHAYPAAAAWVSEVNGHPVEVFLRDNPDGDGDVRHDNDLKIYVLARARSRQGAEVMVESLCGLVLADFATQQQPVSPAVDDAGRFAELPVSTYGITE